MQAAWIELCTEPVPIHPQHGGGNGCVEYAYLDLPAQNDTLYRSRLYDSAGRVLSESIAVKPWRPR